MLVFLFLTRSLYDNNKKISQPTRGHYSQYIIKVWNMPDSNRIPEDHSQIDLCPEMVLDEPMPEEVSLNVFFELLKKPVQLLPAGA